MNLASIVNTLGHVNEIHKNMDKPFIGGLDSDKKKKYKVSLFRGSDNIPVFQNSINADSVKEAKLEFIKLNQLRGSIYLKSPKFFIGVKRIR